MTLLLRAATATDLGLHRDNNEDSLYAGRQLLVVADGVGGQPAGEVASELVIRTLEPLDAEPDGDPLPVLRAAVEAANRAIREAAAADPEHGGMATTVTALLLCGDQAALVHVGDSRAYRLRDGELTQLTTDHTYVQWLVQRGMLKPEEARHHPKRSVVTQVAQGEEIEPQTELLSVRPGDRFLVCSDGLSDVVVDADIRDVLVGKVAATEAVADLVTLALRGGGPDNISVVIADAVATGTDPRPESGAVGDDDPEPAQKV
ncbi:MAG: PP2C family protein-serine/threonine phosphatase [Micromonosporaceae bacterium]